MVFGLGDHGLGDDGARLVTLGVLGTICVLWLDEGYFWLGFRSE